MGERRGAYRILVGKSEEKSTLGKTRYRWEDNIEMDLQEVEWWVWSGFVWLRIRKSSRKNAMNLHVP
jgi:hypothetical protein